MLWGQFHNVFVSTLTKGIFKMLGYFKELLSKLIKLNFFKLLHNFHQVQDGGQVCWESGKGPTDEAGEGRERLG